VRDVSHALFGTDQLDQLDGNTLRSAADSLPNALGSEVEIFRKHWLQQASRHLWALPEGQSQRAGYI